MYPGIEVLCAFVETRAEVQEDLGVLVFDEELVSTYLTDTAETGDSDNHPVAKR